MLRGIEYFDKSFRYRFSD